MPEGCSEDDPAVFRFPSGAVLHLAHHGDVTGSNAWQHVSTVVVIGRPAMDRMAGERMAEVIAGRAVDVVLDAPDSWWPTTTAGIRMADGTGRAVTRQPTHPDPLVEAYRWSVTEGAVLQAIGRPRGVRRTAANPLRVVLLAALALPLTVAEQTTWEAFRPDRMMAAKAEAALFNRAMPMAPVDMAVARPDLWSTTKAAERFLESWEFKTPRSLIEVTYKASGGFKSQTLARYRKPGARRWSVAWVPVKTGQVALEDLVGVLAAYEVEQAAASLSTTTDRPAQEVVVPVPAPAPPPSRSPPASASATTPLFLQVQRRALQHLSDRLEAMQPQPEAPPAWVTPWPQQHNHEGARQ